MSFSYRPFAIATLGCCALTAVLGGCSANPPAAPPAAPDNLALPSAAIEIRTLDLWTEQDGELLELSASEPLVWTSFRDPEGRLVLELPNAVTAAGVGDLTRDEGLVESVRWSSTDLTDEEDPEAVAASSWFTRMVIATRSPTEYALVPDGSRLRVELVAIGSQQAADPARPPAAAPAPGPHPPGPGSDETSRSPVAVSEPLPVAEVAPDAERAPADPPPTPSDEALERTPQRLPAEPETSPPAPTAEARAADKPASLPGDQIRSGETFYELQLGLFVEPGNAAEYVEELGRRGHQAYIVEVKNTVGEVRETVRLGPYATLGEARKAAADLRTREGIEAIIRWRDTT